MKKVEILAPAGNMEKLRIALAYGADAIYSGLDRFNLREKADNFTYEQLSTAVDYTRNLGKKLYVTLNIAARNKDIAHIKKVMENLSDIGPDAMIISDIGLIELAKKHAGDIDIHVSTQANILNTESAKAFCRMGAKRLILARELSLKEVKEIKKAVGKEHEIEIFVHGSMCISYSGRCYLSAYMADRDANRGDCAQPCRWKYSLVEQKRPGEYYPVFEDDSGAYILNSKDLNLVNHIPELLESGADSFKIEGRMKSSFYVAATTKAYRIAFDDYMKDSDIYFNNMEKYDYYTNMASHRQYTTAYCIDENKSLLDKTRDSVITTRSSYESTHVFTGVVLDYDKKTELAQIHEMNPVFLNDDVVIMSHDADMYIQKVTELYNEDMQPIEKAHHPAMKYFMKTDIPVKKDTLIVKEVKK